MKNRPRSWEQRFKRWLRRERRRGLVDIRIEAKTGWTMEPLCKEFLAMVNAKAKDIPDTELL